jgi:hypothetical protein
MFRAVSARFVFGLLVLCLGPIVVHAQQITGTPGSPSATVTIDGKQLPAPDLPFGGTIQRNALQSKAWWPPRVSRPRARRTSC